MASGIRAMPPAPAPDGAGYAKLAAILKNEMACTGRILALSETDSIPADCSLLIIASGRQPAGRLSSNELFQVQNYLTHGNARLLALLDTTEGLDPVLSNWGVVLPDVHVVDPDKVPPDWRRPISGPAGL